jgi:MGT family glycosyltransferase
MGRFLFVTWAGGGNVHPLAKLGARLVEVGHEVRVLGPRELTDRFTSHGMAFVPHRTGAEWMGVEGVTWPRDDEEKAAFHRGLAADVIAEAGSAPTDVLVVDYMQPDALCAAELSYRPVVAFVHTLYARMAVGPFSPMLMLADVGSINRLRDELGLPSVERITDLLDRATRVLVTTVPELDRPDDIPDNVRYVGPILQESDDGWTPPWTTAAHPLVVVAMGTTSMDEAPVVQLVLDAIEPLPVRVLVTLGEHLEPAAFRTPDNAVLSGFVHHSAVLPDASLFIGHGGLGGISAALAHGVPVLSIPLGRDQPANAEHVEAVGAGRSVSKDASMDDVRAAVAGVLADASYREAAQRMASVIAGYGNGARAIDELEALL